ncbi:Methylisocitrate lyase [hydrothermal vent metagenome]|uniref:Methylisocitrate lyase n=1 Tax=hydrothermal vent metagenome TaxID=652676 RepID=A0A3B0V2I7_9ZZZZ
MTKEQQSAGAGFRYAVECGNPLKVVGTITALSALMAEKIGHQAIYLSGGGVAANSLGMPDLGISSLEDVLIDVRRITDVCGLPLLIDVDTGWGGAFNIARTTRSVIKAGAAAMHMEDQVAQKRCGHRPNKEVASKGEMVDRLKSAVDARTDDSFVIMARTDALAIEGLDLAIERMVAYVEAGADMIFPEAVQSLAQYEKIKAAVKVPILANITEFGKTELYSAAELAAHNVDIVLYCCSAYRAMNKAAQTVYESILEQGHQKDVVKIMQPREDMYDFLGYHKYEQKLDTLFSQEKK